MDLVPIHSRHVGPPEVFFLKPPGLGVHLLPLLMRNHRHGNSIQINPTGFPGILVLGLFGLVFKLCRHSPDPLAGSNSEDTRVQRQCEVADFVKNFPRLIAVESPILEDSFRVRITVRIVVQAADDRVLRIQGATVGTPDFTVPPFRQRESNDAIPDVVEIDSKYIFLGVL